MIAAGAIETERLRLEPLAPALAAAVRDYYDRNREHLQPWEPVRAPDFYTLAYHERDAARSEVTTARGEAYRFAAFEHGAGGNGPAEGAERGYVSGLFNLWNVRRGAIHAAVLGYSIDAARQGRGIATEAVEAVVQFAFDVLRLHRVEASYQPTNVRSGRILRKLGFVVEGYARDFLYLNDAWTDAILTARTNPDWSPATAGLVT